MHSITLNIFDETVQVNATENFDLNYLKAFYPVTQSTTFDWHFNCIISKDKNSEPKIESFIKDQMFFISGPDSFETKVLLRKKIREILICKFEQMDFSMLHSAAIYKEDITIIFVGESGSGKTTLSLDGIFNYNFKLISNDHLVFWLQNNSLMLSTIPTYIPIKIGCYLKFRSVLPHYDRYDGEVQPYLFLSNQKLRKVNIPLYFTNLDIGQAVLPIVEKPLSFENKIYLIKLRFDESIKQAKISKDRHFLQKNIRNEWIGTYWDAAKIGYDTKRSEIKFMNDSRYLIDTVLSRSKYIEITHNGKLEPILEYIDTLS